MTWERAKLAAASGQFDDGLKTAAQMLLTLSNELDPDLTGALAASASVIVKQREAAVSYSDIAAVYQHERLDFFHDNGQAKFLETALTANQELLVKLMAQGVRRALQ